MNTIAQVAEGLKEVLTTTADEVARQVGFVKRQRKLSGSRFVQGLVFGWLDNPEATLEELTQQMVKAGVPLSAQALDARFTPEAAECMRQVLETAMQRAVCSEAVLVPLLQRFSGVYLHDSTVLSLPAALHEQWPGISTNSGEKRAAMKVQVRLDLTSGSLDPLELQAGKAQDRASMLNQIPLPPGSLWVTDLGYFSLKRLRFCVENDFYFLSRIQVGTYVLTADDTAYSLCDFLAQEFSGRSAEDTLDVVIRLGKSECLPCRLIAWRVPEAVVAQRRRQLQETARKQQRPVNPQAWALATWTCLATNAPAELLSPTEAEILRRSRWQVELLFKLWKSQSHLDHSRSQKPYRVLCEVYAKLLAVLIQHWVLVATCWSFPDRSLTKAAKTVRKFVQELARHVHTITDLQHILTEIQRCLACGCRIEKRRKHPSAFQILLPEA